MSDITVVGLGQMGSALARAIQSAGHDLTVWNRSTAKMRPFTENGIAGAADAVSAITASPVILICIANYTVANALLRSDEIMPLLTGRTIVQLSTGTPLEARDNGEWMTEHGVFYLDGAILCGPSNIGTEASQILVSGDETAYAQSSHLLDCLGGNVRYVGGNVRIASTLDLAWLCESYGRFLAITHAACLCESEDVNFDLYATLFPGNERVRYYANIIAFEDFDKCTATLSVWGAALQRIQRQAKDAGINTDFPDYAVSLFEKASHAGYGEENVMSLVKVLRRGMRT